MAWSVQYAIFSGLYRFLEALQLLLIVYALMTWFVRPDNAVYRFLYRFLNPILTPFKRLSRYLINRGLRIDLSVWFAVIALRIIQSLLTRFFYGVF